MSRARLHLLGRFSGIVFVLLFLADIVLTPGEPDPDSGPGAVASYYAHHGDAVTQVALLHTVGGLFFLLFLGFLLDAAPRSMTLPARVTGYAGVLAGALGLVSYAAAGAAADLASRGAGAQAVAAVAELRYVTSSFAGLGLAVMLAASTALTDRTTVRALAGVASMLLLAGVLGTFGDGILGLAGFIGTLLFAGWVVAVACLAHRDDTAVMANQRARTATGIG